VIEVGVDVPNATVMVVEHAERFWAGAVASTARARGTRAAKSYCILITGERISRWARSAAQRHGSHADRPLSWAELDLLAARTGRVFWDAAGGVARLRVANLLRDRQLLELAKMEAAHLPTAPAQARRGAARRRRSSARASGRGLKRPGSGAMIGRGRLTVRTAS